jgi:hypothetical protein
MFGVKSPILNSGKKMMRTTPAINLAIRKIFIVEVRTTKSLKVTATPTEHTTILLSQNRRNSTLELYRDICHTHIYSQKNM